MYVVTSLPEYSSSLDTDERFPIEETYSNREATSPRARSRAWSVRKEKVRWVWDAPSDFFLSRHPSRIYLA